MASGDGYSIWNASTALVVTGLHSLATSPAHTAGWASAVLVNTGLVDRAIDATIKVGTTPTTGEIRMYFVRPLHDVGGTPVWPDVFTGIVGTKTVTNAQIRNAICEPGPVVEVVAGDSGRVYPVQCPSVADIFGSLPERFLVFITHSSGVNLDAATNAVWEKGSLDHAEA